MDRNMIYKDRGTSNIYMDRNMIYKDRGTGIIYMNRNMIYKDRGDRIIYNIHGQEFSTETKIFLIRNHLRRYDNNDTIQSHATVPLTYLSYSPVR